MGALCLWHRGHNDMTADLRYREEGIIGRDGMIELDGTGSVIRFEVIVRGFHLTSGLL